MPEANGKPQIVFVLKVIFTPEFEERTINLTTVNIISI